MFLLYDLIFIIFAMLYLPYVILKKKWHDGFKMRFGFLSSDLKKKLQQKENIWIHAVSVGEVMAVKGFVDKLQSTYPDRQIVVSTVTTTGNDLACKQFPNAIVIYAPLDFSLSVRAYLNAIKPVLYAAAETEIWPNIFYALHRRGISIFQVNGRISDKSYPRYKSVAFIIKHVLAYVDCFCMQTQEDAERIKDIGAKEDRVFVTGNMKFDDCLSGQPHVYGQIYENDYGPVFAAGSTHPGEEEIVLNVYKRLREKFSDLSLILAPRHIERVAEVEGILAQHQLVYTKFSDILEKQHKADDIILVDTIGHLRDLYSYATVVFVGKSLVGVGGQNIIEPAAFGKPVIVGPYTENFRATIELFLKGDALIVIPDEQGLFQSVLGLLDHPNQAVSIGTNGKNIIESQQGAVSKTLRYITAKSHF